MTQSQHTQHMLCGLPPSVRSGGSGSQNPRNHPSPASREGCFFFMYSLKQPPLWNSCTLNVNKQQMKVADGISNTKSHMTYIEAFVLASPAKCTQAQVEKITRTQSLCCWAVNGSLSVCFRQIASMRESVNLPLTRTFLHLNVSVYPTSLSQHEVKVACALASALYSLCPNRSCSVNDMSWLSV